MGSPKALLPYRGHAFLEHLLDVTSATAAAFAAAPPSGTSQWKSPGIGIIRVVLGAHAERISDALALDPAIVVRNPHWEQGQLSSIQAAIRSLPNGETGGSADDPADGPTDGMILFLVDHPLISATLVNKLAAEFYRSGRPIVVPTLRGKRGHPVIFGAPLYGELLEAPADQGARAVLWAHAADVLEVPTDEEGVLLNLNDPDALRRAME
jgi:molybdenum cofactor cytidylyltransferase